MTVAIAGVAAWLAAVLPVTGLHELATDLRKLGVPLW